MKIYCLSINFRSFLLIAVSFFVLFNASAQNEDVFVADTTHSPRKATIYSAVLPGWGQAYNKKYWKIPIVYAAIGGLAFVLLFIGNYKLLEKVFVGLVVLMSLSFLITAIITRPDVLGILKGMFIPRIPEESILTVIALVGTTVVPYNLFLHASLVSEKWKSQDDLKLAQRDTFVAIVLGGSVSMAIIIAAAAIPEGEVNSVMDMAKGLEPLYGDAAKYFMGIGLFAAGVTSSITAPLAAAYVANSCFGWKAGLTDLKFKMVWMLILALGVLFMTFDIKPIEIIKFAQIANGILLPLIAIFLLWVVNRTSVMGKYKNTQLQNGIGIVIILMALLLGAKSILKVLGMF